MTTISFMTLALCDSRNVIPALRGCVTERIERVSRQGIPCKQIGRFVTSEAGRLWLGWDYGGWVNYWLEYTIINRFISSVA